MNRVVLIGRLTKSPEVKNTTTGKSVATFTLAVDRRFKNKDGQKEADFVPIVIWGKQAEFVGKYMSKGSQCSLSGRLQVRSYDAQDGTKRYVTEVIADEVNLLGSKKDNQEADTKIDSVAQLNNDPDFVLMDNSSDDPPF